MKLSVLVLSIITVISEIILAQDNTTPQLFANYKNIPLEEIIETSEGCDYWQSPIEMLVRGIGDCDDFAIAKYISLRLLEFFPKELRVAVLKSKYGTAHAVLLVYFESDNNPLVLDNETFEYSGLIDSHILRLKYRMSLHKMRPIYSLNEGFWAIFKRGLNDEIADSDPLLQFPEFYTALINSKRILPNKKVNLFQTIAISSSLSSGRFLFIPITFDRFQLVDNSKILKLNLDCAGLFEK